MQNADRMELLRTLAIPDVEKGSTSQCSVAFSPDGRLLSGVVRGEAACPFGTCRVGPSSGSCTTCRSTSSRVPSARTVGGSRAGDSTRRSRCGTLRRGRSRSSPTPTRGRCGNFLPSAPTARDSSHVACRPISGCGMWQRALASGATADRAPTSASRSRRPGRPLPAAAAGEGASSRCDVRATPREAERTVRGCGRCRIRCRGKPPRCRRRRPQRLPLECSNVRADRRAQGPGGVREWGRLQLRRRAARVGQPRQDRRRLGRCRPGRRRHFRVTRPRSSLASHSAPTERSASTSWDGTIRLWGVRQE